MPKKLPIRKVARADEFGLPRKITAQDFEHICSTCQISAADKALTKVFLDHFVDEFRDWMRKEKQQPDRRSDSDRLKDARELIKKTAAAIDRLGPQGLLTLESIAPIVAPMLSAQWLNHSFPDDDYAPQRSTLPVAGSTGMRTPMHAPMRQQRYFIEEQTHEARQRFVSSRPKETVVAVLKTFEAGLDRASTLIGQQPGSRGGRKPLRYRHYFIINLAKLWSSLNKDVFTGDSEFAAFVSLIFDLIGWPNTGLIAAIPDAVTHWHHLAVKT